MYDNIGGKLKTVAQVGAALGVIASIILGIVNGRTLFLTDNPVGGFLLGLLIAGGGSFLSWLGSLLMYGVGEIAENTEYMTSKISRLNIYQSASTEKSPMSKSASNIDQINQSEYWICAHCGQKVRTNRSTCWACGKEKQ